MLCVRCDGRAVVAIAMVSALGEVFKCKLYAYEKDRASERQY